MSSQSALRAHVERAAAHSAVGRGRIAGRLKVLKRGVLRVANLFAEEQAVYNREVVEALRLVDEAAAGVTSQLTELRARAATEELAAEDVRETAERLASEVGELRAALEMTRRSQAHDGTELRVLRSSVGIVTREARRRLPEVFDQEQLSAVGRAGEGLDQLHVDLAGRLRGSPAEVRQRQRAYLGLMEPLRGGAPLADIGTGRGEWLSLLKEAGLTAYGIETNEVLVDQGREAGLDVRLEDAREHLRGRSEASLGAVTAFQVAEHLSFHDLVEFLDQALRVLIPGGLILLETPNPANLIVGTSNFWLDPTHRHPLPSELMEFLLQARGFLDVEVVAPDADDGSRLTPVRNPGTGERVGPEEHIRAMVRVPMDYAIIGKKAPL